MNNNSSKINIKTDQCDVDVNEVNKVNKFLENGCDCKKGRNMSQCCTLFNKEYYLSVRALCQELEHGGLDLAIMGFLMGSLTSSEQTDCTVSHRKSAERKRNSITYYHRGHKVINGAQMLHSTSKTKFLNIKSSFLGNSKVIHIGIQ